MNLTESNYFTLDANREYFSVSQFKSFQACQAAAMAEITGEWIRPETDALLMGSYVDAHFSGTGDVFMENHPEIFNSRTGALKSQYRKAGDAIERAERDPMFMEYMNGETQRIMTGELFGQPWKCKIDVLHKDKIVDMKFMRDMKQVYRDGEWKTFVQAYGYDLQGYVYQKIVEQVTGKHLPFYLAVITKEEPAAIALIHVEDKFLNPFEGLLAHYVPEYARIKAGEVEPERCEDCAYCRKSKVITEPIEYATLFEE